MLAPAPAVAIIATILGLLLKITRRAALPMPPGPPTKFLLGNALEIRKSKYLWLKLDEYTRSYGGIITCWLLRRPLVALSDPALITELFEKRAANFSSRPPVMMAKLAGWSDSILFTPYGPRLRTYRKLFHQTFNPRATLDFQSLQIAEVKKFMSRLAKEPADFLKHAQLLAASVAIRITYGYAPHDSNDKFIQSAEEFMAAASEATIPGRWLVESMPFLRHVPSWFPGATFKRKTEEWANMTIGYRQAPFDFVIQDMTVMTGVKSVTAWARGQVASALFLDVKGAFPHAVPARLADNMLSIGVPEIYVKWMLTKLERRSTCLAFDDYESDQLPVSNGIDQGCPLSVIFYLLYNSGLVRVANCKAKELCLGYIDDITFVVWGKSFEDTHSVLEDMMNRPGGALDWSRTHHSEFELDKTACIDFATRKEITRPPLVIGPHTITPTRTHTLLGVCLDQELRWNDQANNALAKGMAWVSQLGRLARFAYGATPATVRRLYLSVAVPRFTYAADVWYAPVTRSDTPGKKGQGSVGIARRLARVQNVAARAILGAMRSTPIDTLNSFASLLPMHLRLNAICHRSALRLASNPANHPLTKAVTKCARGRKKHAPPLQKILHFANCNPAEIEKRPSRPKGALQRSSMEFPAKEAARKKARRDNTPIKVFADGASGKDGVASAAVLFEDGRRKAAAGFRLADDGGRTTLEAEVAALLLAFHLVWRDSPIEDVVVYSDSQVAIRAVLGEPTNAPGVLLEATRKALRRVKSNLRGVNLRLEWCPAHAGIPGNDEADREAKTAARGKVYTPDQIPPFLSTYAPLTDPQRLRESFLASNIAQADHAWEHSTAAAKLRRRLGVIDPRTFFGMVAGLNRSRATLLFRLISGHIALAAHLHKIGCADSNLCPACGTEPETVTHFLLRCPAYEADRHEHLGSRGREFLLLNFLLPSPEGIRVLLGFIKATRRFADSIR